MSKKDFIALADHIKDCRKNVGVEFTPEQLGVLAQFCKKQNPRFNLTLWLDYLQGKCGPSGGALKRPN